MLAKSKRCRPELLLPKTDHEQQPYNRIKRAMLYLLSLSQIPIILILGYIYVRDTTEREPLRLIFKCFLGGLLAFSASLALELLFQFLIPFETTSLLLRSVEMFFGVALVEEGTKLLVLLWLAYRSDEFNEPFDGIVYAVAVSLGLAAIENAFYSFEHGIVTAWVRMFTAVPLHAMCAILMGFYLGQAKFEHDRKKARSLILLGLTAATIAHGSYDYFVTVGNAAYVPIAACILIVQIFLARRAIAIHRTQAIVRDGVNCAHLPPEERFLIKRPVDLAIIALRILLALGLFWAFLNFYLPWQGELGDVSPADAQAAAWGGLGACILIFASLRGLRHGKTGAWKIAFGVLVLTLPTPAFVLSLIGLYGLLHPETRQVFLGK